MPELHSKCAKVRQEAHDQAPLDPGGVHVDALRHEDEVEDHAESDRRWENNSWNSNLPSFILDVDFECQCCLNPAGQRAKSKSQGSSDIMDFFIICELKITK